MSALAWTASMRVSRSGRTCGETGLEVVLGWGLETRRRPPGMPTTPAAPGLSRPPRAPISPASAVRAGQYGFVRRLAEEYGGRGAELQPNIVFSQALAAWYEAQGEH